MNEFTRGALPSKNHAYAVVAVALISAVSGCQDMGATKTNAMVLTKPAIHPVHRVAVARATSKPVIQVSSAMGTARRDYAFTGPLQPDTPAPVKVSALSDGGPFLGHSPYICGPSGFGQRATCRARF